MHDRQTATRVGTVSTPWVRLMAADQNNRTASCTMPARFHPQNAQCVSTSGVVEKRMESLASVLHKFWFPLGLLVHCHALVCNASVAYAPQHPVLAEGTALDSSSSSSMMCRQSCVRHQCQNSNESWLSKDRDTFSFPAPGLALARRHVCLQQNGKIRGLLLNQRFGA